MDDKFYSYSHSFMWYRNRFFKDNFEYFEQYKERLNSVDNLEFPGMATQPQLEGLRLCQEDYNLVCDSLDVKLYEDLEFLDTPHMVRKVMMATRMPLRIITERSKPTEEIISATKILTNRFIYRSFEDSNFSFYYVPYERGIKKRVQIQFQSFQDAMDEYILKAPKRGDYATSRLFIAIHNIIETNQLSYFQEKFPESFTPPFDDSRLKTHLMTIYSMEFPTHAERIITELRRLSKIDVDIA